MSQTQPKMLISSWFAFLTRESSHSDSNWRRELVVLSFESRVKHWYTGDGQQQLVSLERHEKEIWEKAKNNKRDNQLFLNNNNTQWWCSRTTSVQLDWYDFRICVNKQSVNLIGNEFDAAVVVLTFVSKDAGLFSISSIFVCFVLRDVSFSLSLYLSHSWKRKYTTPPFSFEHGVENSSFVVGKG
jgi:hypothetical protein